MIAARNHSLLPLILGVATVTAHCSAFSLRFGGRVPEWESSQLAQMLPWLLMARGLSLLFFRRFVGSEYYAKIFGLPHTLTWTVAGTFAFYALVHFFFGLFEYPRSVFVFDTLLLILFLQGVRLVPSNWYYRQTAQLKVATVSNARKNSHYKWDWQSNPVLADYMVAIVVFVGIFGIFAAPQDASVDLPFDRMNPVIYDNDETIDAYTDEYLMSLASAGEIKLLGMITSTSIAPYNKYVALKDYERMVDERWKGVLHARHSGLKNIPEPVRGPAGHLRRPESGVIEDTQPIASEGSWLIVNEARKTNPTKPLVIVMGGPITVAADAFLLDKSIADKVIVSWIGGQPGYNDWADAWAEYIALEKLRIVQFLAREQDAPIVPKGKLSSMPNTALRQWMLSKEHPIEPLPGGHDGDGPAAICLMRDDYVVQVKRVSFSHWIFYEGHDVPMVQDDPNGKTLNVTRVTQRRATAEFWRAVTNPAAYRATASVRAP